MNIDTSKLSRDYKANPVTFGENIPEVDLRYLYIELNLSLEEVGKYFNCSTCKIKKNLRLYAIKKSMEAHEQVRQRNFYNKYGCSKFGSCKELIEKRKKTCLERYGNSCSLNNSSVREKAKLTCRKHYGVDYAFQSREILYKAKQTLLKTYGETVPLHVPEIKEKARNTSITKYGVASAKQVHYKHKDILLDNVKLALFIKKGNNGKQWTTNQLSDYFNISISAINIKLKELDLQGYIDSHTSKEESVFADILRKKGIHFTKFRKNGIEFDFYIPDKKIAIEFNGNYWHSTERRPDKKYHINKSDFATKHGIYLYHIFEYEWYNKTDRILGQINNLLGFNKISIPARKCIIAQVSAIDSKSFLNNNHVQGDTNAKVRLGLFYNNELVALMTFGKPRFSKQYAWELVRFCCKVDTTVIGGASKLFKYFIKNYNPTSIVSYSDIAKTTGNIYNILGFEDVGRTLPNYVWVNHNLVLSRYKCQKHKLLESGFGNLGTTEDSIMKKRGYVKIYDCGNRVHVWRKTNGN